MILTSLGLLVSQGKNFLVLCVFWSLYHICNKIQLAVICWKQLQLTSKIILDQIYLLQKSALRIIFKIPPGGHVTSYFKKSHIMPIKMLFKYRFSISINYTLMEIWICKKQVLAPQDQRPFFNPREPTTAEGIDHC